MGNRLSRGSSLAGVGVQAFGYSANDWLTSDANDFNGNTVGSDGHTDVYDYRNRLIRRTSAGGEVIDISYDAYDDRFAKTVGTATTYYLVDCNNLTGYSQVVEELVEDALGSLTVQRVYAYGHDLISQTQLLPQGAPDHWATSYYLYDGLGTVRALADETGLVTDAYSYDAFGVLLSATGDGTPNAYRYTGEQWDTDLGMYFLRARYLDPETGRFHTLDTYEGSRSDPQTLHKYLYAHANPVMGIDPSGMFTLTELVAVTAIIGTLASITVSTVGLSRVMEEGWDSPDIVFGGLRGRFGGSSRHGISYTASVGGVALYDGSDLYLSLAAGFTLSMFSRPGSLTPRFKGLEHMFGAIWGKDEVASGFSFNGFSSYWSAGALRVALIGFQSVLPATVVESLKSFAMAIQRSRIEVRIGITPSMTSKAVSASISLYGFSGKAGNSPLGLGLLSFRGAINVNESIGQFYDVVRELNRLENSFTSPDSIEGYIKGFNY